jgi:hypothetical protein
MLRQINQEQYRGGDFFRRGHEIIALRALVGNHQVGELGIAVVAFQDPFGHKDRPYLPRNLLKIQKNIYLPLVLSESYRTKTASEKSG